MEMIILLSLASLFLILSIWAFFKKERDVLMGLYFSCFAVVLLFLAAEKIYKNFPNGLPIDLMKKDGIYQVQIIKEFSKNGQKWIGVLVLKEEGETDPEVPPYGKILASFFKKEEIVYGLPRTIELKTLSSRRVLIMKE